MKETKAKKKTGNKRNNFNRVSSKHYSIIDISWYINFNVIWG